MGSSLGDDVDRALEARTAGPAERFLLAVFGGVLIALLIAEIAF